MLMRQVQDDRKLCLTFGGVFVSCFLCHFMLILRLFTGMWAVDFFQTLPMEIQVVWSTKLTGTAILFLVNRYAFGVANTFNLATTFFGPLSDEL